MIEKNNLKLENKISIKDVIYLVLYFIGLELILLIPTAILINTLNLSISTGLFLMSSISFIILTILGLIWYKQDIKYCYSNFISDWKKTLRIILIALIIGFLTDILINSFILVPKSENQLLVEDMFNNFPIVESISIVLLAPIIEEIVFRHILIGKLSNVINIKLAIIISCVLFSFMHSGFTISIVSYLLTTPWLTLIYIKSGKNIVASIVFHSLWNFISLIMIVFI
ncbi:CPBP family intramembrane glutamic endopeptidase [Miniphocaeibacter massiliensis]|uniref:CPBP family intramembrane glutamic endopeptidase n=1 Tax=Miniphocaeibacter massiliensis TaxID=2041841 RepID=UPI000C1C61F4|nr:type II CAAX endopeptidase family protein [Miniphocaeibacter massiliensis]